MGFGARLAAGAGAGAGDDNNGLAATGNGLVAPPAVLAGTADGATVGWAVLGD